MNERIPKLLGILFRYGNNFSAVFTFKVYCDIIKCGYLKITEDLQ